MTFPRIGAGHVDAYFRSPVVRFGRKCLSSLTKMLNFDVVLDCHIAPTHLITNVVRIFPSEISAAECFTAGSGQRCYLGLCVAASFFSSADNKWPAVSLTVEDTRASAIHRQ